MSSTLEDLQEYRTSVRRAVQRLQNHADDMIFWSADEKTPVASSISHVRNTDLLILLVAHRYGHIPENDTRSITEIEFDTAIEQDIPILAFFVESDFPWPPAYIELETDLRDRLDQFKLKVEQSCTRKTFTTTDSLEIAVSQALANYDRRLYTSTLQDDWADYQSIIVWPRSSIGHTPDLSISLGISPDGLPLVLSIKRSADITSRVDEIARFLYRSVKAEPFVTIEKKLVEEGRIIWSQRGIYELQLPNSSSKTCFKTKETLTKYFSPTLLASLVKLPPGYVKKSSENVFRNDDRDVSQMTAITARSGQDVRLQSTGGGNRFLAVSIEDDSLYTAGWVENSVTKARTLTFWRNFIFETLEAFSFCSFSVYLSIQGRNKRLIGNGKLSEYSDTFTDLLRRFSRDDRATLSTQFSVPRQSVAEIIVEVALELDKLHKQGRIHGDLKPSNILFSQDGPILIDSLSLKPGEIAHGMTPGWAAPEQLMLKPVSEAADLYPLAIMLVNLINGELTGKILSYAIPGSIETRTIIDPLVFVDPPDRTTEFKKRGVWLDFLEKCLNSDPMKRPHDAGSFAKSLRSILKESPIRGNISMKPALGSSPKLIRKINGDVTAGWVIY